MEVRRCGKRIYIAQWANVRTLNRQGRSIPLPRPMPMGCHSLMNSHRCISGASLGYLLIVFLSLPSGGLFCTPPCQWMGLKGRWDQTHLQPLLAMGRRLAQTRPLLRLLVFRSLSHEAQMPRRTRLGAGLVLPVQTPLPLPEWRICDIEVAETHGSAPVPSSNLCILQ